VHTFRVTRGKFMWLLCLVLIAAVLAGVRILDGELGDDGMPPAPGSPSRAQVELLVGEVTILSARPHPGGYERGCTKELACVFGPAWTDETDAEGGGDNCDTRNNVLAMQLRAVSFRERDRPCTVVAGELDDPYTGRRIEFSKSRASEVQIDHIYPLAAAWDMGASRWPIAERRRFANDIADNLLAVSGKANSSKGDRTPEKWLPPNPAYHCFYAAKYLTVALRYQLPVTAGDREALLRVAETC
jgi:hypothetical protein